MMQNGIFLKKGCRRDPKGTGPPQKREMGTAPDPRGETARKIMT
jgi:hypothetical protein